MSETQKYEILEEQLFIEKGVLSLTVSRLIGLDVCKVVIKKSKKNKNVILISTYFKKGYLDTIRNK